jgi:hypothetical protein
VKIAQKWPKINFLLIQRPEGVEMHPGPGKGKMCNEILHTVVLCLTHNSPPSSSYCPNEAKMSPKGTLLGDFGGKSENKTREYLELREELDDSNQILLTSVTRGTFYFSAVFFGLETPNRFLIP